MSDLLMEKIAAVGAPSGTKEQTLEEKQTSAGDDKIGARLVVMEPDVFMQQRDNATQLHQSLIMHTGIVRRAVESKIRTAVLAGEQVVDMYRDFGIAILQLKKQIRLVNLDRSSADVNLAQVEQSLIYAAEGFADRLLDIYDHSFHAEINAAEVFDTLKVAYDRMNRYTDVFTRFVQPAFDLYAQPELVQPKVSYTEMLGWFRQRVIKGYMPSSDKEGHASKPEYTNRILREDLTRWPSTENAFGTDISYLAFEGILSRLGEGRPERDVQEHIFAHIHFGHIRVMINLTTEDILVCHNEHNLFNKGWVLWDKDQCIAIDRILMAEPTAIY